MSLPVDLWVQALRPYGLIVVPSGWEGEERTLVLRAVRRMAQALGGVEGIRRALGAVRLEKRKQGGGGLYAFWPRPPWMRIVIGEPTLHQQPEWLGEVALVHELAHAWDARTANVVARVLGRPGRVVREMMRFVGEEPGPTWYGSGLSGLRRTVRAASEEWAETVAAYLYPEYIAHLSSRPEEQGWPQRTGLTGHVRPGLGPRHHACVEERFREIRRWCSSGEAVCGL